MVNRNHLYYISSDLKRFSNKVEGLSSASFPLTFWFRISTWLYKKNKFFRYIGIPIYLVYKIHKLLTGIQLPMCTDVGPGLRFFHYNCIIIAQECSIGKNASIHQGVTIGRVFNGPKAGVPVVGDNVVIFAGAKIVGNIRIGNNVVVAANAVVIDDVPDNCVVAGIPAKVVSKDSSKCFSDKWVKTFAR